LLVAQASAVAEGGGPGPGDAEVHGDGDCSIGTNITTSSQITPRQALDEAIDKAIAVQKSCANSDSIDSELAFEPKPDASNVYLLYLFKQTLADPDDPWTWEELVEVFGWSDKRKWLAGVRQLADELGLVKPTPPASPPQARPCVIPTRIIRPAPKWTLPPPTRKEDGEDGHEDQ
jgi:hypothetical protein